MRVLGIIPARGGSKRLPNKNILDLGGKPLLQWTLDAAIKSEIFEDGMLWVSSEDERIGEVAGKYWWKRDPLLARDETPTLPVILDVYHNISPKVDAVILLQVTSPFRTQDDIRAALDLFNNHNADVVLSTVPAQRDTAFITGHANRMRPIPDIVNLNGAIYIVRDKILDTDSSWYEGHSVYSYSMPKERSIDIDVEQDLLFARCLLENGLINGQS